MPTDKAKIAVLRKAIDSSAVSRVAMIDAIKTGMVTRIKRFTKKHNVLDIQELTADIRGDAPFLEQMSRIDISVDDIENVARGLLDKVKSDGAESIENERKVGRNEPCPCGSEKKYKKCCGR